MEMPIRDRKATPPSIMMLYHDAVPTIFECKRPWTPEVIIMEGMFLIN